MSTTVSVVAAEEEPSAALLDAQLEQLGEAVDVRRRGIRHRDPRSGAEGSGPHISARDALGELEVAREDAAQQPRAQVAARPVEVAVLLERESGERDHRGDDLAAGRVELGGVADGEHAAQRAAAAERLQRHPLRRAHRLARDERAAGALAAPQHRARLADDLAERAAGRVRRRAPRGRATPWRRRARPTRRAGARARRASRTSPSGRSAASEMARCAASAHAWRA